MFLEYPRSLCEELVGQDSRSAITGRPRQKAVRTAIVPIAGKLRIAGGNSFATFVTSSFLLLRSY